MRHLTRVVMAGVPEPVVVAMEFDAWVRTYREVRDASASTSKPPVVQVEDAAGAPVLIALDHFAYAVGIED